MSWTTIGGISDERVDAVASGANVEVTIGSRPNEVGLRKKPTGGAKSVTRLEPPPTPPRYTADGVWRPASPGWGDRPGEPDTRPLPAPTRKTSR